LALLQGPPSIWGIFGQIIGGLFFYDLFFFLTHFPLHSFGSRVFSLFHARHHSNSEVRAVDTIKLTAVEEFVDVACSIAALR
jgi:sterol desaturase/sphingolipid hydroxylase (fatty acid hydroxylase superfamily)